MFDELPTELITQVFSYLPRQDRIYCSLVCRRWREALYAPVLWKNVVVCLDNDLFEPSMFAITKECCSYFESVEFCWTNPRMPIRWMQRNYVDISKRACRFLTILNENIVQLNSITIMDWYDLPKFKKFVFHLCQFLRNQHKLTKVCFLNMNFSKIECVKLLRECLVPSTTLTKLDISNCHYPSYLLHEADLFLSILTFSYRLHALKIDYSILCIGLLDALRKANIAVLELLEVYIKHNCNTIKISNETWELFSRHYPKVKVAFYLKNVSDFDDISVLLKAAIPLTTFSLHCGKIWTQYANRKYRSVLSNLIGKYNSCLENVYLQVYYNQDILDDLILMLIQKCTKLRHFDFCGIIEDVELLWQISQNSINGFKYFHVLPKNVNAENHYAMSKVQERLAKKAEVNNLDYQISNNPANPIFIYY